MIGLADDFKKVAMWNLWTWLTPSHFVLLVSVSALILLAITSFSEWRKGLSAEIKAAFATEAGSREGQYKITIDAIEDIKTRLTALEKARIGKD